MFPRCDHLREHGHRYVGAELTDLDDGHDGRESLEARGHVFTGEHQLPDWNQSFRPTRPQDGQVSVPSVRNAIFSRGKGIRL